MLTSDQLHELAIQAGKVGAAKDTSAATELLTILLNAEDSNFAALDLGDLKNVMQIAALLAELGDNRAIGTLFGRCLAAMQALDERPPAAEFILPLYNLRATYLIAGASKEANELLGPIVEAASHADTLSDQAMRVLMELLPEFEASGYPDAAVILYRPVYRTLMFSAQLEWSSKLMVATRMGRLQLANGQVGDAVQTYEQALAQADAEATGDLDGSRMTLWYLIAEAKTRGDDPAGVEQAYETAKSLAEASDDPESREAGVIYHNLAGFWLSKNRRDRYAEAVALTQRALAIAETLGARQTSEYAGGLGQVANLKAGLGEAAEAQKYYDACFAAFSEASDTDPSDVADFRDDEGRFRLEAGQPEQAAESFVAAREIRDRIPATPRDKLADTHGWVGVANFESGNFAAASAAFRRALDLRMDQPPGAVAPGGPL